MRKVLPASFYDRDPSLVAPELLGKYLVRHYKGGKLVGMIVETEAYLSKDDEAAHAFSKRSPAKESLYKRGGHAYVHRMRHHALLDIVAQGENVPGSVLIRAIQPIEGIEIMKLLRMKNELEGLADGPGKVCQAFAITVAQDGLDVTKNNHELYILEGEEIGTNRIFTSPRIGITKAIDMPLRFYVG